MRQNRKILRKFFLILAIFSVAVFLFFSFSHIVFAQPSSSPVDPFGGRQNELQDALGLGNQDPRITIAKIIRVFLGLLGIMAIGLTLYGGWLWMTSGGNEQKIDQAKKVLRNAVVGIAIILASFGIVQFILNALMGATIFGGVGPGSPGGGGTLMTALGNGIVGSHYPARGAIDIPRNTKIVITFKEPMTVGDLINAGSSTANIVVYQTQNGTSTAIAPMSAAASPDGKTFVFLPVSYLGSPSERIWYSVGLTKNIRKASGQAAFGGVMGAWGYNWSFQVSTIIDITPPQVESVVPTPASTEPRNVVIQINFNEAVDPLSASGQTATGFTNIVINDLTAGVPVDGTFYISNQYKTVEFLTDDACGVNSCGETIYCLPGNRLLEPLVRAATVPAPPLADGVVDMASNSLDGDADGLAEGPVIDDYRWQFNTNNTIEINPPYIDSISPSFNATNVGPNQTPQATFNKFLMSSTLNNTNIVLVNSGAFWIGKVNDVSPNRTTALIFHEPFDDSQTYEPRFLAGIRDIYQNCYKPCGGPGLAGVCAVSTSTAPSCCDGAPFAGPNCP